MRDGWSTQSLADCCQIKPPKKEARERLSSKDMASFVPMNDLGIRSKELKATEDRPLEAVSGSYTYFSDGDVLLAKITPCFENGKLGIARGLTNGVGFGSSEFIVLRANDSLEAEYLFYFLSQDTFRDSGAKVMSGAVGHKRVPKEFIENQPIPIPPLPEQKRIVAILDEAFAGIDAAIANTQKNLANARELFESYLNAVFSRRGEGWEELSIADISNVVSGYSFDSSDFRQDGQTNVIKIANVGVRNFVSESTKSLPKHFSRKFSRFSIPEGSVVIALTRSVIADGLKVAIVPNEFDGALLNQRVAALKFSDLNMRNYVFSFLCTRFASNYVKKMTNTLMQPNLSITDLRKLPVPIAPASNMIIIVKNIEALRSEIRVVESNYQRKLTALTELKQSLLQKAFSGELTADNVVPISSAKKSGESLTTDSPAFAAHIMAAAYHWHESQRRNKTFGHVKAQKTLHLVEALAQIDLGRAPIKDAAGPNDFAHMRTAEQWAKDNDFYQFVQRSEGQRGYDFVKGKRFGEWLPKALDAVEPYRKTLDRVVGLLMPLDTKKAELVATTYAAWNNLLLDGAEPTDDAIIHEARDNWHRDKQKYSKQDFRDAIDRLRSHGMVPTGTGKRVTGQTSLL